MFRVLAGILIAFTQTIYAAGSEIQILQYPSCGRIVTDIGQQHYVKKTIESYVRAVGDNPQVILGGLENIWEITAQLNGNQNAIRNTISVMEEVASAPSSYEILGQAFGSENRAAWENILLCGLSQTCSLGNVGAGLAIPLHWKSHSLSQIESPAKISSLRYEREITGEMLPAVFLFYPAHPSLDLNAYRLEYDMLHEFMHHFDTRFFNRWVQANEKLLQSGSAADELFEHFSFKSSSGVRILSYGLWQLFIESRAHFGMLEIGPMFKDSRFTDSEEKSRLAWHVWNYLHTNAQGYSGEESKVLKYFAFPSSFKKFEDMGVEQRTGLVALIKNLVWGSDSLYSRMSSTISRSESAEQLETGTE